MNLKSDDELVFLPLGGSNEIGMNLNLYGFGPPEARKWIVVDVGVTFGDLTTPGVEVITPDPSYAEDLNILGIVLTHAHEDHIGALPYLFERIKAPIYATPFTAFLVREKLRDADILGLAKIHEVPLGGHVKLGPFSIDYISITHSILEPNGLAITTPLGVVLHTGDWKIDDAPVLGAVTDVEKIRKLGDQGVLAMVCDSTNVFVEGRAGSEADVGVELTKLIASLPGRVAVACFASNVARLYSVIKAAEAAGRRVSLVGRSMIRMVAAARSVGALDDIGPFLSDAEASSLPREQVLYLCTGSQGEPRAALSRIAEGNHPHASLSQGDSCVFSSRVIPGNEIAIRTLQNKLADRGVRLYTDRDHPGIHVSGHPCRAELADMYAWARPKISVPTHGERRHLLEHAAFAKELQVPHQVAPRNGDMIRLAPGHPQIIDEVPAGRLFVDGGVLSPEGHTALRERRHAAHNGMVFVAFALDKRNKLATDIDVRGAGLPADGDVDLDEALDDLAEAAEKALNKLSPHEREDEEALEGLVSRAVKKAAQHIWDRRPLVETIVMRV